MNNRKHLLYMATTAVAVLGGLWAAGVALEQAAYWALLLACPLMMVAMMLFMNHRTSPGHEAHRREEELRHVDEQYRR